MPKFKMQMVVDFAQACAELRATATAAPVALCAALRINSKRAQPIVETYNEERDAIVMRFADRDDDGNPIQTQPGVYKVTNGQRAMAEIATLGATEVDFEPHPIDPAHLPDTLPPRAYDAIMDMIEASAAATPTN